MKKLSKILIIGFFLCILESCKHNETIILGSIYGTITDVITSEPIRGAHVELLPIGLTIDTGDEGLFEFAKVEGGTYNLYVTKKGYTDYKTNNIVVKGNGDDKPINIQLEKLPPALTIVDDKRNKIDSIDFGSGEITQKSFGIFNDSEDSLEWNIVQSECPWIKSFSKEIGTLKPNQTQSIVCTIDRNKLKIGENSTIVHIVSNDGSKELKVIATSISVIETLAIPEEDIGSHTAVFHGRIARNLDPLITEYGFVYSTKETPTLTNGAQKISNFGSPQIGEYEMQAIDLDKLTKYYVCAFVTNADKTYYGTQKSFTTISHVPDIMIHTGYYDGPIITATTINLYYSVTDDGGLPIEEVGICWGTNRMPTKDNNYLKTGNKTEKLKEVTISNLLPETIYYLRAYAKNSEEENYSEEIVVLTASGAPTVTTVDTDNRGKDYLIVSGISSSPDNILIQRQGVCYSLNNTKPTIYDQCIDADNLSANFTCILTNLNGCSTYHCRAFAINEYNDIAYGDPISPNTLCDPATLQGFVYDQDGSPIQGAKVGVGKRDGTYDNKYSSHSTITNNEGYYEMTLDVESPSSFYILVTKDGYVDQNEYILINPEQIHSLDFNLSLVTTCDMDLGTGFWANGPSHLLFECSQSSLAGRTTQRNIRMKNYRSVPISYSFSNIPSIGIVFSNTSGTIPAKGETSVTVTFTYPATNNSQVVSLPYCTSGNRAYVWNWENIAVGQYVYTYSIVSSTDNQTPIGVGYGVSGNDCCACCQQNIFVSIGDEQVGFTLTFNQFVTY